MPEKMLAAFAQALERFRQALETDAESDLLRAGCIQYFEFCFELAWKSIKVVAGRAGQLDCLSPRAALKQAFANRWIDEEEIWLDMLESRNLMAHTYSAEAALQIYRHLAGYLPEMERLLQVLEKEL
ncbi:MAG: hypothetical protein DRI34_09650 [Deltaproteobacteria bacterium]|nr:MAG: hypothetical protein DRI34_09650 [Deltaproteobacteria bacterium]